MQTVIRTTRGGNDPEIKRLLGEGWEIKTSHSQSQGYSASKTCCLGGCFLPLALLGKKKDVIEYVLEKPEPKQIKHKAKK